MKNRLQILAMGILLFVTPLLINAQALTGNKIVGPTGDYTSLAAAITDINTKGVTGTLTLLIDADLTEAGGLEVLSTTLTGNNKLVIKPNASKTPTITFTTVATSGNKSNAGFTVSGATTNVGNITIDGSNTTNGTTRDMTWALNDATNGRFVIKLNGEADDITVKKLKIIATAILPTTSSGSRTYGINCLATATGAQDRLTVQNCQIGSSTSAFYYSIYKPDGGTFPYGANLNVAQNNLFGQHKGLSIWGSDGTSNIINNVISVPGHPTGAYVQNSINGIYVESWKGTVNIANNKVVTLKAKALSQAALRHLYGIIVYYASNSGNTGQTANVYNNFVSDFYYEGDATTAASEIVGIAVDALDQIVNVYFNTVYMNNSATATNPIYGIRVYDDAGQQANIKNNIVVNVVNQDNAYAMYVDPIVNNALKTSDYNDLFVSGANANVGYYNSVKQKTLANWRTATGKDANSININPANPFGGQGQLTSVTNLHWVSKPAGSFAGTPITGITTDIDGDTRSTTKPYMGADEGSIPLSIERDLNAMPTEFTLMQNYPNPFNPSTTIKFNLAKEGMTSLIVYDILGKEVATLVNQHLSAGAYTVKFNAYNFASGIYLYRITAGSFSETKQMILTK